MHTVYVWGYFSPESGLWHKHKLFENEKWPYITRVPAEILIIYLWLSLLLWKVLTKQNLATGYDNMNT